MHDCDKHDSCPKVDLLLETTGFNTTDKEHYLRIG